MTDQQFQTSVRDLLAQLPDDMRDMALRYSFRLAPRTLEGVKDLDILYSLEQFIKDWEPLIVAYGDDCFDEGWEEGINESDDEGDES